MKLPCSFWLISALLPLAASAALADSLKLPAGVQFVNASEGISAYRLQNGLTILLAPSRANAQFSQYVTYLVGSEQEGPGEGGMAHLLEHMMFKGTPTHKDIPTEMRERGANFNAETSNEYTVYYATLKASRENLDFITALEADRMVNSLIRPEDLKSEMTVVMNEFDNGENSPGSLLYKAVTKAAYSFHPIGRDVIGNRSEVAQVPASSLKTFYQRYYQPGNAVVILSGNFDPQYALERVNATYGKLPRPTRTLSASYAVEPPQQGEKEVSVRRVGNVPLLMSAYHIPAANHPDAAALQMLQALLGQEPEGRLYQELVRKGLASSVGAEQDSFAVPGLSYFIAELPASASAAQIEQARSALNNVVENVGKQPFSEAEVEQMRKRLQARFDRAALDPAATAESLVPLLPTGDWRSYFLQRDALLRVTASDVNRVAARYLRASNRTLGTFYPTPKPDLVTVPATPGAAELLKDFKPKEIRAAGEQIQTDPAALEARTQRGQVAGLRSAYFRKETRDGRVYLRLSLDTGDLSTEDQPRLRDAAGYLSSLLLRGSRGLTPAQLKDRLAELNASLDLDGDSTSLTLSVAAPPDKLPQALALAKTVLREPLWPQADFDELKRSTLTSLQGLRDDPKWQARRSLERAFDPANAKRGNHDYIRNLDELLQDAQAVTLDDVERAYKALWGYAGSGQLAVVGPADKTATDKAVTDLLSGWRAEVKYVRIPEKLVTPRPQTLKVSIPDKSGAVLLAQQAVALRRDDPDYAPLLIATEVLGGDSLSSRLATKLRQQAGQSYTSGVSLRADDQDRVGALSIYATAAPSALSQSAADMLDVLREALAKGFSDGEVERVKASIREGNAAGRSTDSYLLEALISQLYLGQTFKEVGQRDAALQAVTPQQARAALQRYLNPAQLVVVEAGSLPQ